MNKPMNRAIVIFILWQTVTSMALAANPETLHPRGNLSPEQIRRRQEAPKETLYTDGWVRSPEEESLVAKLDQAKKDGNPDQVRGLEEQLADLRGAPLEFLDNGCTSSDQVKIKYFGRKNQATEEEKWLPHEYLVGGSQEDDLSPQMVADSEGIFYCLSQVDGQAGDDQVLYYSEDSGEHWFFWFLMEGASLEGSSLAVGEGNGRYLFWSFLDTDRSNLKILRVNLDPPYDFDIKTVYSYNPGTLANPRLASDTDEYDIWYIYLVFNVLGVDNWILETSRTIDAGESWTTAQTIGSYCGYPGNFYDGNQAHPDMDFGSGLLYIAFDNYASSCSSTARDIFVLTSSDFGGTWNEKVQVATSDDDEYDPAVTAARGQTSDHSAVVAWTRNYEGSDHDIWYRSTQDGGQTWGWIDCIACSLEEEGGVNLGASPQLGMIHAVFRDDGNIDYAQAPYGGPYSWFRVDSLSTSNTVFGGDGSRPGLLIDPTKGTADQAGTAWVDSRNQATRGLDIYFDAGFLPAQPDDYLVYSSFHPPVGAICGIDGFVDTYGLVEGIPGAEYIVFTGGALYSGEITAYLYRVETSGDGHTHPDNPDNTGPIALRTFTLVSSHYMGFYGSAHDNAFFIDDSGIYYGASDAGHDGAPGWTTFMGGAIWHWDFQWNLLECVVPAAAPAGAQTLAHNNWTGDWWVGTLNRDIYKWDGSAWVFQFTAPTQGGIHHDGLVVIENSLYVADMTSNVIQQYRLTGDGEISFMPDVPFKTYYYSSASYMEGMGFGPNHHIWFSTGSSSIFEIGGGNLQLNIDRIPDQCIAPDEIFRTFDLDDYVVGEPPFSWSTIGGNNIFPSIDSDNVVTMMFNPNFAGRDTVIFTVEDGGGYLASDQVVFTISPTPVVGDIPDVDAPVSSFNLDAFLVEGDRDLITWSAYGMDCLELAIDPVTHDVHASFPAGCDDAELIIFTAYIDPCPGNMYDQDAVLFSHALSPAPDSATTGFGLGNPSPNPCISSTRMNYSLPTGAAGQEFSLAVYDLAGHRIQTLTGDQMSAGTGQVRWNCRNERGEIVSSGVYFIRMNWGDKHASRRVVLIR